MMTAIDDLQRQLDNLRRLRATGTHRIEREGAGVREAVMYRTDAELAAAIADLEKRIATASGGGARTIRFQTSKGL